MRIAAPGDRCRASSAPGRPDPPRGLRGLEDFPETYCRVRAIGGAGVFNLLLRACAMADSTMKVRAIAPWFGGKRTMAPLIVTELGKHTQYFEPFCGSMAVLFAKDPSRAETVNDLHGDLTNLARVLRDTDAAPQLYDRLQTVLFSEDLLKRAGLELGGEFPPLGVTKFFVDRAYWFFLASWMMRNGVAGTARLEYQAAVRWTKNGGSPTVRWRSAVESIPAWHERLKNVVILSRDGLAICNRFEDTEETAIYADPPYLSTSRSGFGNHGNGSKYKHEFDHSGGMFGDDHQGRGARPKEAPEILIINGPSYADTT
jgi:site-specific DNA-adenine methylase